MLESAELRRLSRWCRARKLSWQPGVADDGNPALLLDSAEHGGEQRGMMLFLAEDEWRLLDGPGHILAAASGLPELLDALDAGVGEPDSGEPDECYVDSASVTALPGGSVDTSRKRLGSAIM